MCIRDSAYADRYMDFCQAEEYIQCKLADTLMYKDEVISYLKQLSGCLLYTSRRKNYTDFLKLFCNTLNNRCVTKHVFITEDTGGCLLYTSRCV